MVSRQIELRKETLNFAQRIGILQLSKRWAPAISAILLSFAAQASDEKVEWSKLGGKLNAFGSSFFVQSSDFPNQILRTDFELEQKANLSANDSNYQLKLVPWVWLNAPQPDSNQKKDFAFHGDAREAWIERTSPNFDLRIGNQIFSWGAADKINPTDVINSLDYTDPFRAQKLPVTALRAVVHPQTMSDWSLELVASPLFRDPNLPFRIPESGVLSLDRRTSRWLMPVPNTVAGFGANAPLLYEVTAATYPSTWMGAARLSVARVGGWDFSGSYFNGVENLPRFSVGRTGTPGGSAPITATLYPSFHRMQMAGVDGAGSITLWGQQFGTRFESAFVFRDNSRVTNADPQFRNDLRKENYSFSVLGVDTNLPFKVLGTAVYMNGQFVFYERVKAGENKPGEFRVDGLPSALPFDRNGVFYLENRTEIGLKFSQAFVYSFLHHDGIYSPTVSYSFSDTISGSLGADFYYGEYPGFFGQFDDHSRLNAGLSIEF